MILEKDRDDLQDPKTSYFGDGVHADEYDGDTSTGFVRQDEFDAAFKKLMDDFVTTHWDCMEIMKQKESGGKRLYKHNSVAGCQDDCIVEIICGTGADGLWYRGPKQVL